MSISERIVYIMQQQGFTASKFAEILEIQRSGLSHIYSGRNKPSVDFLQKLISKFPQYKAEWILNGTGEILHDEKKTLNKNTESKESKQPADLFSQITNKETYNFNNNNKLKEKISNIQPPQKEKVSLEKIIMVYNDGTFEIIVHKK